MIFLFSMPGGTEWLIISGAILLFLIPSIFFLITQQNTLKAIQPQNRSMSPGEVWLQLIPVFGLVWQFIVVTRISDSLKREFQSWDNDSILGGSNAIVLTEAGSRPTYEIGIAYCVLFCCGVIPLIGTFATIAGLVCWIIYWVRLAEYKNKVTRRDY